MTILEDIDNPYDEDYCIWMSRHFAETSELLETGVMGVDDALEYLHEIQDCYD